jgi:hypothetical protein
MNRSTKFFARVERVELIIRCVWLASGMVAAGCWTALAVMWNK